MTSDVWKIAFRVFWFLALSALPCSAVDPRGAAAGSGSNTNTASEANPAVERSVESRPANYQLTPGDTISVTVFREPEMASQQRLSRDGTVNLPLLGIVKVAGKNTNDAAAYIAALLDARFIVRPQVSVSIVEYAKAKFSILGQVASPGSYDIPAEQSMDIITAIAKAGGFTRLANPSNVLVRRITGTEEETFKIDVKRLMNDKTSRRFMLQPNDSINVGERFF